MDIDEVRASLERLEKKLKILDLYKPSKDWVLGQVGQGGGDMSKSTYDPNADGKIAEAQLSLTYATHSNSLDHNGGTQDTAIAGKANATHSHIESDVTNLSTDLSGKAAISHSHNTTDITGTAVITTDSRLSDARTPVAHNQAWSTITTPPTTLAGYGITDAAPSNKGVTNGDTHDHIGGDGNQIDHTGLANIGTNTHSQIDTFVASKAAASGLASLDANSKCVQGDTRNNGGIFYAALANGTTAMALATNAVVKVTPTATATYTTTVPSAGNTARIIILTSGTTSYTITFGSGFKPTGTLATGTTTARVFVISWVSDGTNLYEVSRTVAMVA